MHHFLTATLALLATVSTTLAAPRVGPRYVAPNGNFTTDSDVRTSDIVAYLNSAQPVPKWTALSGANGGESAIIPLNVWEAATSAIKSNLTANATRAVTRREDEIKEGVAGHKAFFSSYSDGPKAPKTTMDPLLGAACTELTKDMKKNTVKVIVSKSFKDAESKTAKGFFTMTSWSLENLKDSDCQTALTSAVDQFGMLDSAKTTQGTSPPGTGSQGTTTQGTATQGGKLGIYQNKNGELTSGNEIAEIRVEPAACTEKMKCDAPTA
jgi:hypothetical protein